MAIQITCRNYTDGTDGPAPVNEAVAQEVLDYLFRPRYAARPWLDDPDGFERRITHWKKRIFLADGAPEPRVRRTWEEEAYLLRQPGPTQLSWADTAAGVQRPIGTVRAGVARVAKQKAAAP